MSLQANDFIKISKALEKSYQSLMTEFSSEDKCIELINKSKEEYRKAMLYATIQDDKVFKFTND